MTLKLRAFTLLIFSVLLAGCSFEHPLTGSPSENINTWLLGVWEHKDEKGRVFRAEVLPLASDRYTIWFRAPGRKPKETKEWRFEAWPSRVGNSTFLTLKCEASDEGVTVGKYVFFHTQMLDQLHVVLRGLQLDSATDASSYDLRREVRAKLKDRTLLPEEGSTWTRIAEAYWKPGEGGAGTFTPNRFPGDRVP
jgi:hypothetical protein